MASTSPPDDALIPPKELDYVGAGDFFREIGDAFLTYFVDLGGLKPTDRVLDVGSGTGRMAVPLTRYLQGGEYDGIEIVPKGVNWCRERISSRYPNFRFHHADIHNTQYSPEGTLKPKEYVFPFPRDSFDFVFLASVFTHMLPDDVVHYLDEISRVMRPGGRCLITFALLNDESKQLLAEGKGVRLAFPHDLGVYRVERTDIPEAVVAYEEEWMRSQYGRAGLRIVEPIHYGSWAGREQFVSRQDIVIAEKSLPTDT